MLKGLILGILLGILLVAGGVYYYFSSGRAPVATSAPPIPFEKSLARLGLHAYLDKLPHPEPQVPADEANLVSGAKVYKEQCADRKSTRLNSSHLVISYAVFCLKKKKRIQA